MEVSVLGISIVLVIFAIIWPALAIKIIFLESQLNQLKMDQHVFEQQTLKMFTTVANTLALKKNVKEQ